MDYIPIRIYLNERHKLLCKNYERAADLIAITIVDPRMPNIPDIIREKYELAKDALSDWLDENGYKYPSRIQYEIKDKIRTSKKTKGHEKA